MIRNILHEECEYVWNTKESSSKKKLDHLEKKIKGPRVNNIRVEEVRITDADLFEMHWPMVGKLMIMKKSFLEVRLDFKQKQNNRGENLTEEESKEEIKSRMLYDFKNKELHFSKRRVTEMKHAAVFMCLAP